MFFEEKKKEEKERKEKIQNRFEMRKQFQDPRPTFRMTKLMGLIIFFIRLGRVTA